MKQRLLILVFLTILPASNLFAWGMYGFYGGVGMPTAYKGYKTFTAEGYFLKKLMEDVYGGGAISYQSYSFLNDLGKDINSANYGDMLSIRHKSSYLFLRPKLDVGIGYRQYVHLNVSAGPGFLMGGSQYHNKAEPFWVTPTGATGKDIVSFNVSYNIPSVVMRYTFGVSERIPTHGYWNIMLSQEFSYIPTDFDKNGTGLHSHYISFTVGIMHKYPQAFVEY
jgi:hypothetical protein